MSEILVLSVCSYLKPFTLFTYLLICFYLHLFIYESAFGKLSKISFVTIIESVDIAKAPANYAVGQR